MSAPPLQDYEAAPSGMVGGGSASPWLLKLARWESLLVVLLIGVLIYNAQLSPYFWDSQNILDDTSNFMEIGLLALPITLIIIAGHIDLSVGSTAALASVAFAERFQAGWNVWACCAAALTLGAFAGFFNGMIITRVRLPSLVVTLGTFALYRGLASGILGNTEVSGFPDSFVGIDLRYIGGSHIPAPLVIFAVAAVLTMILLHGSVFGRYIQAIGNNEQACRFSGVAVDRVVVILFTLSGLISALAGLMLTSRLQTSRSDLATNFELQAITAAVLGGANIFGGSGTIVGTVLALFVIGLLQNGLGLANISGDIQTIAVGVLLILSILLPGVARRGRVALGRWKGGDVARTVHGP
jgi:rhamnose transport system permease protein